MVASYGSRFDYLIDQGYFTKYSKVVFSENEAKLNPGIKFYCYSKSLNLFLEVLLPNNFYMVASYGGRYDHLIDTGYFPKYSKVVFSEDEAKRLGLEIDKDDSLCFGNKPFALLLHGMQEKGSEAGEALKLIKRNKKQLLEVR